MTYFKITVAFLAALAMSGCEQSAQEETPDEQIVKVEHEDIYFDDGVTVTRDNKRGVTCWVFKSLEKGGISCIPDWMLDRGAVEPESLGDQQ